MVAKNFVDKFQKNASKPCFWKCLSPGQTWKSKSMRMIPEKFVRSTPGAFEHRIVLSVRWENSWQPWLDREKDDLFMIEEDWDEFVDDNHLGPNDTLFFRHDDTMNLEVQIFKSNGIEIIDVPLEVEPETEPVHLKSQNSHKETATASASVSESGGTNDQGRKGHHVTNPEQYLLNPENPYFVKAVTKRNDVLYVSRPAIHRYDLKFGPLLSTINYLLPGGKKMEGILRLYNGHHCFNGWSNLCRKHNLHIGDSVVCEIERSGGLVSAIRVHFVNEGKTRPR
ncbi:PREDICTED: B3 domain-containing protein At5g25475-like [Camelina sativa]|uniref:B3 domain-containing protein At5g25475-like n=1 Tax=Camelina sativa TaxID=90675 RepID=A0ABM0VEC0_CAMSA|nr:PREDICTED: B3 domain-containing protein At5g25475-like [Camelina sativa]XP_010454879.1 PREDICTED: B3 domain-containing protein At5g25475-like [Camelina sativa]